MGSNEKENTEERCPLSVASVSSMLLVEDMACALGNFIELWIRGGYTGNLQRTYIPREIGTMLKSEHQYYLLNKQSSWLLFIVITCKYMSLSILSITK